MRDVHKETNIQNKALILTVTHHHPYHRYSVSVSLEGHWDGEESMELEHAPISPLEAQRY